VAQHISRTPANSTFKGVGRAPGRAETSFTEHVNELRLKRAFMLLKAEREGHACISDIGLQAGFSDISHFNRVFRARFGDTPSGVRARGLPSGK
jgi:transcriptional regulator GlxA family with amidase domain